MKSHFLPILLACLAAGPVLSAADHPAKINVLLVTGGHGFEEAPFYDVFKSDPDIRFTAATQGKTATVFERDDLQSYDVVVLYDMVSDITPEQKKGFLALFEKGVGLVVMHHALASYQAWPDYERVIGGKYLLKPETRNGQTLPASGYEHDMEVPVVILAKNHPITAGLRDFTIHDEIYWDFAVGHDVTPLITTTHPKSGKPLAWCRNERKSRVVYLQLGHDHQAYENPSYRKLVAQSIRWAARRSAGNVLP